ncbi:hypothetical protein F8568_039585 [Actinomadura sp. LD22]|uniref:NB-ARC domain-containing protein n=1 Tax=Actinomadura physcomitrii TaxID=2650748 RepID=A0A6I4MNR9_9ACTN|nr:NB-ARC domain-containing protein [Actinomadura physcomitrii]MWA06345.1 hypothetical protein [Actinomadura physcomitrii]
MSVGREGNWKPLQGRHAETRDLAGFLREVVRQYRRSTRSLEGPMLHSKSTIAVRLSGEERPDWEFVEKLIRVCAGRDAHAAGELLKLARSKWEAADPSRARLLTPAEQDAPGADSTLEEVRALLRELVEDRRRSGTPASANGPASSNDTGEGEPIGQEDDAAGTGNHPGTAPARPGPGFLHGPAPGRADPFVDRGDLVAAIARRFARHPVQVVHGPLGVGKTQVALRYVHRFRLEYGLIAWVPAARPAQVRSSLAALAPHLGLEPPDPTRMESAYQAVLNALAEASHEERWLLVLDDAGRPELIQHLVPHDGGGDVLVTSRDAAWRTAVAGTSSTTLGSFTREQSVAFLTERLRAGHAAADVHRLAERLGDHPLALQQAASMLGGPSLKIPDYLRSLSEGACRALSQGDPGTYPMPMGTEWELSAARLGERCPDAMVLLRHCASLESAAVSIAHLRAAAGVGHAPLAELLADPLRLDAAVEELGRAGLAFVDDTDRTMHLHTLIRALVRDDSANPAG